MVQQQVIRETVTEEGITKKAEEIKQVSLSLFEKPCSCFLKDSLLGSSRQGLLRSRGSSARADNSAGLRQGGDAALLRLYHGLN